MVVYKPTITIKGVDVTRRYNDPRIARRMSLIALAAPVCRVCDFYLIFIPLRVITMNQKPSLMQYR